ncbi:dienelactone hydrolase family protein [Erythrobacter sp. SCSIO 43205]|uniref:dienelactone hydrolase family protein n=1 Tax=Erythrobacter sp. SCSIO 43205 TaxID=2779361 RepID=UPI001CA81D4C|nr:dienelactone hydrolase family protein [Erythrobacter sp. SCSIO 43205]UAB78232.1 dienelactone hydrolase family protein [Erythrobacter sp. SCSIO 43205]
MCDEAKLKEWARGQVNRRELGVLASVAALSACAPSAMTAEGGEETIATTTSNVTFETADGTMDAVFIHPTEGEYPAVIFWPDIASIRPAKINMASRLASEGYAVLVLNPYYRDVSGQQFEDFADFIGSEGFAKVSPWREKLDADSIGRDAVAAVEWLDAQEAVDTTQGIGTQGYCMGGPFTVWSAAAVPSRIKAAASFHGGGLVRDDYDKSPHKVLGSSEAAYLIAVAQDDDAKAPTHKDIFAASAKEAGRPADVKVYAGDHGWMVPDSPAYDKAAAEEGYDDLMQLYSAYL